MHQYRFLDKLKEFSLKENRKWVMALKQHRDVPTSMKRFDIFDPQYPPKLQPGHTEILVPGIFKRLVSYYAQKENMKVELVHTELTKKHIKLFLYSDGVRVDGAVRIPLTEGPYWIPNSFGLIGYWCFIAKDQFVLNEVKKDFFKVFENLIEEKKKQGVGDV